MRLFWEWTVQRAVFQEVHMFKAMILMLIEHLFY